MPDFLLDSDVIIWCLRGHQATIDFVTLRTTEGLPHCSALTVLEVELGMKTHEELPTRRFFDSIKVLPLEKEIARKAAEFIQKYNKRGFKLDFVDAAIAATCIISDLDLITYNLKHYPMPELVKMAPH